MKSSNIFGQEQFSIKSSIDGWREFKHKISSLSACLLAFPISILSVSVLLSVIRLAPVLKIIFHRCVISYTCSQSYSDGSVLRKTEPSELDWLQVYDMTHR